MTNAGVLHRLARRMYRARTRYGTRKRPFHRVYWRSHGCYRPPAHPGTCRCQCGDRPGRADRLYGEDVGSAPAPVAERGRERGGVERRRVRR